MAHVPDQLYDLPPSGKLVLKVASCPLWLSGQLANT
ncbi:hypothetical protein SAMN04488694_1242 [Natrinema hispanicum]|uniref:Uncharacterized protein n=1 Tax=Natrinema hispanicum TaxID=392421 RepID=A0A1I0IRZ6_9EURY|nr:hypothetical protein SAMN04488694_1242 [Natrinema hispanicum]